MQYKVVPFTAVLDKKKETRVVAEQLEKLISDYAEQGWSYLRLEGVSTYVEPEHGGCFGGETKPSYFTTYQMVVFSRN